MERTHLRELPFIIIIILIGAVQQWIERVLPKIISNIQRYIHNAHIYYTFIRCRSFWWRQPFSRLRPFISLAQRHWVSSTSLTTQHSIELDFVSSMGIGWRPPAFKRFVWINQNGKYGRTTHIRLEPVNLEWSETNQNIDYENRFHCIKF